MKNFDLGKKIKDLRNSKGLSQEQLANTARLSLRTVQRIENGETEARGDTLKRPASAFGIAPEELTAAVNLNEKGADGDRWTLALINLSALCFFAFPLLGIIGPIVILGLQKNKTAAINETGNRLINFQISWCVILLLIITSIFIFKFPYFRLLGISPEFIIFGIFSLYLLNFIFVIFNIIRSLNAKSVFYPPSLPVMR